MSVVHHIIADITVAGSEVLMTERPKVTMAIYGTLVVLSGLATGAVISWVLQLLALNAVLTALLALLLNLLAPLAASACGAFSGMAKISAAATPYAAAQLDIARTKLGGLRAKLAGLRA